MFTFIITFSLLLQSCNLFQLTSTLARTTITRFGESYSSLNMCLESKRLKKLTWLNSGNALIQWVKNSVFVFPVLPGSAEAQVIWGSIAKCLLIAYFIDSISAKKYQNPFTCVKVIASQRWDFLRHGVDGHYKFHWYCVTETICHYNIAQLIIRPHLTAM